MTSGGQVLVLGGTAKTGRRVVTRLRNAGKSTRSGSRSGEPPFDWQDRSTWVPALAGVSAVYLSYFPDLAVPGTTDGVRKALGREPRDFREYARAAAATGVWRVR